MLSLSAVSCGVVPLGPSFFRAPAHDSAIVRSDRLGGNFAYSIQEGHAYQAVAPVVQNVRTPVAVSYSQPAIVPATFSAPVITYESPKVEIKEAKNEDVVETEALEVVNPIEHQFAAQQYFTYEAPKVEVKELKPETKPVEFKYAAPGVPVTPVVSPVHHVVFDAPKVEVKEIKPIELKYTPFVPEAPKVEIKEVKPVEVEYKVPEVQYKSYVYTHALPYSYQLVHAEKEAKPEEEEMPSEESH
ncbi:hypothetical protein QYM36_018172 [Artemia franciscana]|uniref:Uncharacterized protein n=1 Tax=Artemia franciscana TaxID=6661 RepID=A0AA88H9K7_ARTSF|nr:hypothetical protein QYM36_018172 [Artemia franciscana]